MSKRNYDRRAIMRRAHELKAKLGWSAAMKQAWAEAKSASVPALPPQRLPLEALVCDVYGLVKKIRHSKISAGIRIRVDVGARVDNQQWVRSVEASALYQNAANPRLEAR